jgi:NtrC-family two-component system sensor histidine kinase KinB
VTFRTKLLLALLPAAIALVAVGIVSSMVTAAIGRQSGTILADNFRSVLAAQKMKDSLERIDSQVLFVLAGHDADASARIARHRDSLERSLTVQEGNITEPGEREATLRLRAAWNDHQQALNAFQAARGDERRKVYFEAVAPAFDRARGAADEILNINQDAMARKSQRAERQAVSFEQLMIAAIALASLLGLLASATLTTRLLRPLGVVAAAVRRFGQGDVQARARIEGKDEAAQLAQEFNTMADRLERYRASSLGELLQAQQMAQAAIDGLPDPVLVLDATGNLQGANQAAGSVLKVDTDKPDPLAEVDPGVRALVERLRGHVAGGRGAYVPKGFEEAIRVAGAEGERVYLPRGTPIYGETGNVVGTAIVLQEVTRLFRFDELKSNLVATVAHEFRTPLTSLRMALHLCTEEVVGPLNRKQADLLFAAREDCERLQNIVDDLLNLSRIESGRIDLNKRRIAPESLVDLAIDVHRATAQSHGVTLRSETLPGIGEVFADPDRLQLVFSNLLSNAIRYSPRGSEIVVTAHPEERETAVLPDHKTRAERWVRFEVRDEGPGIAREHQGGLFEKFFRVPGGELGGSGLGLFIARGIVQAHGGRIGVESEPGGGSTFWFTIPGAPDVPGPGGTT